jgi:hypothetical protein
MDSNPNPLKIITIYVTTQVSYYLRLMINYFLQLIGYVVVTDLGSNRTYLKLMCISQMVALENHDQDLSSFYVVTTYIRGLKHRIVMHCTSSELRENIHNVSLHSDYENRNKIDRTIYSNVIGIEVDHDGSTLKSSDLRGWNYNLCVLRTENSDIQITNDQWIRAGIFYHLSDINFIEGAELKMSEFNLEVTTLDDFIAF